MSISRRGSRVHAVTLVALVLSALPVLAFAGSSNAAAPAPSGSLWNASAQKPQASLNGHQRSVNPSSYQAYTLNKSSMASLLAAAPLEDTPAASRGGAVTVSIPAPTGELIAFAVVESPIMEPGLAAAHPDITTYAGNSVTEGFEGTIRLDQGPLGFHASVISGQKSWYIDPAYIGDTSLYLSYFGDALPAREKPLVEPELDQKTQQAIESDATPGVGEGPNGLVNRREYRLALVTDPSYAEFFGASAVDEATSNTLVLAAKTALMNRVNQIYNDDLAVKMLLVNGTDKLNFQTIAEATGANGPCGASPCYSASDMTGCGGVIDTNTNVVGLLIGAENYDIGHIAFGPTGDGGGVAYLGQVGMGTLKAGGCTGLNPPTGDFFAIDYVAHEMGHQFGGNHTFNGTQGSCGGGNRNAGTSVEPGSGSSVMAYAGICAQSDLQPHTDPYFSQRSQTEITAHVTGAATSFNEIQRFGLANFEGTDAFTLDFNGTQTATITNGGNYTTAGVKAAIEAVTGATATVASLSTGGFQVTYSGALANTNIVNPTIVPAVLDSFTWAGGDYVKGGTNTRGGTATANGNHNPTVTAPAAKSIPIRTPFTLTGSATDTDGNSLVYLWEQNNTAASGTSLVAATKLTGPLFRVFGKYADVSDTDTILYNSPGENLATTSPSRTFPDMAQVLAGSTNAATGSCPASSSTTPLPDGPTLECHSEFLPTLAYVPWTMTFRLTARDLVANGGGTQFADTVLTIDKLAGPLLATSQATSVSYAGNSSQTVTWEVNSTDKVSLAPNVKISLSTDGGLTFPTVLAASTPNDGTQSVTIPNIATTQARIKIEAVDNYFFDVNDANVTITAVAGVGLTVTQPGNPTQTVQSGDPIAPIAISATTDAPAGVLGASVDPTTPLPAGLSLSARSGTDTAASWTVSGTVTAAPGVYGVTVEVTDGVQTTDVPLTITVTPGDPVTVPDTTITGKPSKWLLDTSASFVFGSTVGGSTFACSLDGAAASACTSPKAVTGLSRATHVFTVAATAAGQTDPTPARAVTTVPVDDTALKIKGRKWKRKSSAGAYLGTVTQTKTKGAVLSYQVTDARSFALVVSTGKNDGKVKVYLNGVFLKKVKLKGPAQKRKVVDLGTLLNPTSGKLTIVTKNKKLVRIEGLGVATTL